MSERQKNADDSSISKKKVRLYLESYLNFGFIEGQDSFWPECVICGEKLANNSMKPSKMKQDQETKHQDTIGESQEFSERKKQLALSKIKIKSNQTLFI